ncbi:MAG: hypothetical protein DDT32_00549 [Syntrophomonadaceae bacterium]|nr:hypothetical protein [Bacillota bacterium]
MNRALLQLLSQEEVIEIILNQPAAMNHEGILAVYEAGPEAVINLISSLIDTITELQERVKALEEQLNKNSRNSNKPPDQIS